MKASPKRKGKSSSLRLQTAASPCLNESLSEKEGKFWQALADHEWLLASMKAPPKKEGKLGFLGLFGHAVRLASMKVPAKR